MAKLPDEYRAMVRGQQQQLEKLVATNGVGPVHRMYQDMLEEITRKLRETAPGTFGHVQLRGMLAQVKVGLTSLLREMSGAMGDAAFQIGMASARSMLLEVAKLESQFTGAVVPLSVTEVARLRGLVQGETSSLLAHHNASLARYGSHLIGTMERELAASLTVGEGTDEAIARIEKVGQMEWWRAERIVRTELAYASSASTRAAIEAESKELDGELWMRWSEHITDDGQPYDDRVAVDSKAMHGQVAPPGGMFTQPPTSPAGEPVSKSLVGKSWAHPPNRPNDRAVLTPWRAHWGVEGWIWRAGRRVPVTEEMVLQMLGRGQSRPPEVTTKPDVPPGFSTEAEADGMRLFGEAPEVYEGVPTYEQASKRDPLKSVHVLRPSELAGKKIYGIDTGADRDDDERTQGIRDAWKDGAELPVLEIDVTPDGKYFVADGNHRLWAAVRDGDRQVAVRFRPVEDFGDMDPLWQRLRELLRKSGVSG